MAAQNTFPEKELSEFVTRLQQAAADNLESVVLYGSGTTGEYDAEFSNVNVLCLLRTTTLPKLQKLAAVIGWWTKQGHPAPLLVTADELRRSADVFAIELMDMRARHRILFGPDLIEGLEIPMRLHRAQLEYELREKLILLRQNLLLAAGDAKRTWNLLLRTFPAFATLFRHAVIAQGLPAPATKREAVRALAASLGFDAAPFDQLLDIREHRLERKELRVEEVAARYLAAVEQVTAAVDRILDTPGGSGS